MKSPPPPFNRFKLFNPRGRGELNACDKEVMLLWIWSPLFLYILVFVYGDQTLFTNLSIPAEYEIVAAE